MEDPDPRMPFALRFVRRRCPTLSDSELEEAARNFLAYVDVVRRTYERLTAQGRDIEKMMEERKNTQRRDARG